MSLKNTILSVTRRTVRGFTVGEIFDRVQNRLQKSGKTVPAYNTVRARVYELEAGGALFNIETRQDSLTGSRAKAFVRN